MQRKHCEAADRCHVTQRDRHEAAQCGSRAARGSGRPAVEDVAEEDRAVDGHAFAGLDAVENFVVAVLLMADGHLAPREAMRVAVAHPDREGAIALANHRRANQFEIVGKKVRVEERRFRLTLDVPKDLPKGRLRLRVVATTDAEVVIRVQSVEVIRQRE